MSSLVMLALFFKFNRFWSIRNLDLVLIVLLAPGLLMIDGGRRWVDQYQRQQATLAQNVGTDEQKNELTILASPQVGAANNTTASVLPPQGVDQPPIDESAIDPNVLNETDKQLDSAEPPTNTTGHAWQRWGYYWMFGIGTLILIRLLVDPALSRRPLLDPNLAIGGLVFFACSLMIFLFANVITAKPTPDDLRGARDAVRLIQREASSNTEQLHRRGPGYAPFYFLPIIPSFENGDEILNTDADSIANLRRYVLAARFLAIASQALIVLAMVLFCHYNYGNFYAGVGAATIYLMLPYTALYTGHVLHSLPAALILWAMVCFRRPWISGILVGLATGVAYYPIFLLPLWASFYWERGVGRFMWGVLISIGVCIGGLVFTSIDAADFFLNLQAMFGFWLPLMNGLEGIWALGWNQWWRLPLVVTFVLFCVSLVAWPTEKNIGILASHSAAIMVMVQYWHGFGGGEHLAWYVPMLLMIVFRPSLKGRVATTELRESRRKRKETAKDLLTAA